MPNFSNLFSIPAVKFATCIAGGLIVGALIFDAGVDVGMRRMGPPPGGKGVFFQAFGVPLPHTFVTRGHGAVGIIKEVGTSSIMVTEPDGDIEAVWFGDTTVIEAPDGPTTTSALQKNMRVIIIGTPNESREYIGAKLIRVLPPPQQ